MFGKYVFKGFMWSLCILTGFMIYAFSDKAGEGISSMIGSGDTTSFNQKDLVDPDTYTNGITEKFDKVKDHKSFSDNKGSTGRFDS